MLTLFNQFLLAAILVEPIDCLIGVSAILHVSFILRIYYLERIAKVPENFRLNKNFQNVLRKNVTLRGQRIAISSQKKYF